MKLKTKITKVVVGGEEKDREVLIATIEGKEVDLHQVAFRIKAAPDEQGVFEAYASVFGNVDSYGEIVDKGAFAEFIAQYFPRYPKCVWAHDWDEPIAVLTEIKEDDKGLYVKGQLVLGVQRAREAYELMKAGAITDWSFGFSVLQDEIDPTTGHRHLQKLACWEVSPVLVGANVEAMQTSIKSAQAKKDAGEGGEGGGEGDAGAGAGGAGEGGEPGEGGNGGGEGGEGGQGGSQGDQGAGDGGAGTGDGGGEGDQGKGQPGEGGGKGDEDEAAKAKQALLAKRKTAVSSLRAAADAIEALGDEALDDAKGAPLAASPAGDQRQTLTIKAIRRDVKRADQALEKVLARIKIIHE